MFLQMPENEVAVVVLLKNLSSGELRLVAESRGVVVDKESRSLGEHQHCRMRSTHSSFHTLENNEIFVVKKDGIDIVRMAKKINKLIET